MSISPTSPTDAEQKINGISNSIPSATNTALGHLICKCYIPQEPEKEVKVGIKAILVSRSGFLCRNDVLELRMQDSPFIEQVIQFSTPNGHYASIDIHDESNLVALLSSSPGALLVKESHMAYHEVLELLEEDLRVRLSFDWVLPTKPASYKVAVVGGRPLFDMNKRSFGYEGPFKAAKALDISVIIVDRPGHWLEDKAHSDLRDEFIAIDTTDDLGLPMRIVEAVKERVLDGILTFSDEFVNQTAKAAEILGLSTEPVQAYLQAHDKYKARTLLCPGIPSILLDATESLDELDVAERLLALQYPVVVKPCRGGGSRGVKRVNDLMSMRQAVQQLQEAGFAKQGILVETYADGPEVDVNFVLWDGEVLFCEISDQFPCQADATDATISDNFAETVMVLPSCLDPDELKLIESSLHQGLLQLGFRSGCFHLEARVQNSSMRYRETDGFLDLVDDDSNSGIAESRLPNVFLIEVNARPPGLQSVFATTYTYGVDYCGLQYLLAVGDRERFAALAKPFSCHYQYWCEIVFVPTHRENITVPDDFCEQVLRRLPDIAPHVSRAETTTWFKVVSPVGGTGFIGYFLLYSRIGRRHVLEMGDRIKDVSRKILDNEFAA